MKRRSLLQAASALGALSVTALAGGRSHAEQINSRLVPNGNRPLQTESNDLAPYTGAWGDVQLRHLLRRSMFGVPPAQFDKAKALGGMNAVLDQLFACADLTKVPLPQKFSHWLDEYPYSKGLTGVAKMNVDVLEMFKIQEVEN